MYAGTVLQNRLHAEKAFSAVSPDEHRASSSAGDECGVLPLFGCPTDNGWCLRTASKGVRRLHRNR